VVSRRRSYALLSLAVSVLPGAGLVMLNYRMLNAAKTRPEADPRSADHGPERGARGGIAVLRKAAAPLPALRNPRVVIVKSARRLTVCDGPNPVKIYRVVVGAVEGDKVREGDQRTPEGTFYVCLKNPQSRYTLSLGLSYPDIEDAERGLRDKLITVPQFRAIVRAIRSGQRPPWNTPLGGEIMIHGGGAERDGTLGCIGMDDEHIRELYEALPVGTPVTIRP